MNKEVFSNKQNFGIYILIAGVIWSFFVLFLYIQNANTKSDVAYELALKEAQSAYNKDIVYRKWAAKHGGVYVPATNETPPNPNLKHIKDRDINASGKMLTLINPAYMTRQVYELALKEFGSRAKITSLKPIREQNAPDAWEIMALNRLKGGEVSIDELQNVNGAKYIRFMGKMIAQQSCLKCHKTQGYKEGDVIGGISIQIPWEGYQKELDKVVEKSQLLYFGVWFFGLVILYLVFVYLKKEQEYKSKLEGELVEKINIQNSLHLSEESYKTFFNSLQHAVYIMNLNGEFIDVNDGAKLMYGYEKEEFLGKTPAFLSAPNKNDLGALGVIFQNAASGIHQRFEFWGLKKNGDIFPKDVSIFRSIYFGQDVFIAIASDISELKLQEQNLAFQKQELQTIFDTTKDGIAILDLDTNFIKVNKSYCDITGLSEAELLATSCLALTLAEDVVKTHERFEELFAKGFIDNFEKRCVIHGKKITVNMSLALLPDNKHMLASIKDITKFKIFEEQAKLASMGEMIGNIAHQWRQPLSVISSIASGMKVRQQYGQLDGYDILPDMEAIVRQTQYLSKTIDDFRNFIKNTNKKQKLSIKTTLENTLSILHSAMTNNRISVVENIADDIEIEGYENELMQAFINIINNARDAIIENVQNEDDRFIFIQTMPLQTGLELLIKDSGGGIPEDAIDRIFEPYFTTKHQSVGTGIGLSMTSKIITQRHNATMNVSNEEYEYNGKKYKGACFRVVFFTPPINN